jgi:hypothetical protein
MLQMPVCQTRSCQVPVHRQGLFQLLEGWTHCQGLPIEAADACHPKRGAGGGGASVSLISLRTYQQLSAVLPRLQETRIRLHGYGGQAVKVLGEISVIVATSVGVSKELQLLVVAGWLG